MTLQSSGQITFTQIRAEFGGGSGQISFSDFYRGAASGKVRNNAANNSTTNLASGVPTSGQITASNFYSQARGFRKTYSAGATNQNLSSVFGDDYSVDYPKEVVINSGVELGTMSTGDFALECNSGGSGTITITNNGTITGAGAASGSGNAGGDAMRVNVSGVTINNNGTIRGGGGSGGTGGTGGTGGQGGQGETRTCNSQIGTCSNNNDSGPNQICPRDSNNNICFQQGNSCCMGGSNFCCLGTDTNIFSGGAGGAGGSGGSGGRGRGYNQTSQSGSGGSAGSAGSAGGTNAGAGGTGGTGGSGGNGGGYAASGNSGNTGATGGTGANGNRTNGSAGSAGSGGSSGGAAGRAVQRDVAYTMNNSGTIQGAYT